MAAPIYRDSRAKFFSRTNFKHDFGPYPFDRELFYDIALIVVRLVYTALLFVIFLSSYFKSSQSQIRSFQVILGHFMSIKVICVTFFISVTLVILDEFKSI